jgi:X-domain of DnaJ-containing
MQQFIMVYNSSCTCLEPYIGELQNASFTDDIIHMVSKKHRDATTTTDDYLDEHQQTPEEILKLFFSNIGNNYDNNNNKSKKPSSSSSSWASKYYDEYKTRKIQLDIVVFLRTQIDPYVNGQMDKYEFHIAFHDEARKIATGSYYGAQFLYIIGTALTLEAQQDISYQQRFFSTAGIVQTTKTITNKALQFAQRLSIAVQNVYTIFRIIIDAARENHINNNETSFPEHLNKGQRAKVEEQVVAARENHINNNGTSFPEHLNKGQRAKKEEQVGKIIQPFLDMAWAYTSHDIVITIHGAWEFVYRCVLYYL